MKRSVDRKQSECAGKTSNKSRRRWHFGRVLRVRRSTARGLKNS